MARQWPATHESYGGVGRIRGRGGLAPVEQPGRSEGRSVGRGGGLVAKRTFSLGAIDMTQKRNRKIDAALRSAPVAAQRVCRYK